MRFSVGDHVSYVPTSSYERVSKIVYHVLEVKEDEEYGIEWVSEQGLFKSGIYYMPYNLYRIVELADFELEFSI